MKNQCKSVMGQRFCLRMHLNPKFKREYFNDFFTKFTTKWDVMFFINIC